MSVALVAIAKNEARFVEEWVAHYLALGFQRITIYDHQSSDGMSGIIDRIAQSHPVEWISWECKPEKSPQKTAYAHAISKSRENWLAFFDLDELLVLDQRFTSVTEFLATLPPDAGAVGINWLGFGSSGHLGKEYGLVRDAFRKGGPRTWGNNHHIKTIARTSCIRSMGIHDCDLSSGRYVTPSGQLLTMSRKRGIADEIDHSMAQLNHYQTKSFVDFYEKVERGRAGKALNDPTRVRDKPEEFFKRLDRNEVEYSEIDRYKAAFEVVYAAVKKSAEQSEDLDPHMKDDEIILFKRYLDRSSVYLEFGCGGSTRVAAESRTGRIYSIDTHPDWIKKCEKHPAIAKRIQKGELSIKYLDIGPVLRWGRPRNKDKQFVWPGYSIGIWLALESLPDLVLVDGRWRVACALQSLLRCNDDARIMVHDWTIRPQYAVLLEYADIVEQASSLVVLAPMRDRDKSKIAMDALDYISDPR